LKHVSQLLQQDYAKVDALLETFKDLLSQTDQAVHFSAATPTLKRTGFGDPVALADRSRRREEDAKKTASRGTNIAGSVKRLRWMEEEVVLLIKMLKKGHTYGEIADRLPNRTMQNVRDKVRNLPESLLKSLPKTYR